MELLPCQPSATGSLQGCLWKGIVGQAQGPVHCEPGSSHRLGTKTRKQRKEMGFLLELSLVPAETEGPMILHHFAFSLPPLTQTVPRNRRVLPGPAGAHRMPEHWAHPAPTLAVLGGSCSQAVVHQLLNSASLMSLFSLAERFLLQAWKARAQGLRPVPVPLPSFQPHTFREHSPSLTAVKAVAKRLLFSCLFSQCTQASNAQQWHCHGWRRAGVCPPCWHSPAHGTVQTRGSPPDLGTSTAHPRAL